MEEEPNPKAEPEEPSTRGVVTRRRFIGLLAGGVALGGYRLSGIDPPPKLATIELSPAARALLARAWEGLDPAKVVDVHVHVLGLGVGGTGCSVHPDATSVRSPVRLLKTRIYKGAAGIHDDARADALFMERLTDLAAHFGPSRKPGARFLLLAFDQHHDDAGRPVPARTEFHTPDAYVLQLAAARPDLFLAAASIHPYRADALDALARAAEEGAVAVKWLPNAMGMDPLDPRCDRFYAQMRELDLTLLTHAGEEQAVHAEEAQELGNPLRLRRPLDQGVRVIVAHCASLGASRDLDAQADGAGERPRVSSYALFRRLADEPRYRGRLFGGLSAMTQFNRCGEPLRQTLTSPALHPLLVNGSDYPLPAIDPLVRTGLLVSEGYLDPGERAAMNELYAWNPLAFDFALKRRLRVVQDGVEHRLPASAFETARLLPRALG